MQAHPIPTQWPAASTSQASLLCSDGSLEQLLTYSDLPKFPRFPSLSLVRYRGFYNHFCNCPTPSLSSPYSPPGNFFLEAQMKCSFLCAAPSANCTSIYCKDVHIPHTIVILMLYPEWATRTTPASASSFKTLVLAQCPLYASSCSGLWWSQIEQNISSKRKNIIN